MSAGIVYRGGDIVTMDETLPRVSAFWVRDGVFEAVGSDRDVMAQAPSDVASVELAGRTVVPGLIDAHCHFAWLGYLLTGADCRPSAAPSIPAILDIMAAQPVGPEGWVSASGYAEYELDERRHPTRTEMDAAVPSHPAVLYQTSLHAGVVNSRGLEALGLRDDAPDPPGAMLGRDAHGRLDGRIYEQPLFDLMNANMTRFLEHGGSAGESELVERAGLSLASDGITACADASTEPVTHAAMRTAERSGRLPIRVRTLYTVANLGMLRREGRTTGSGSDRLQVGGVKVWADGGMSSRTAAVDEPYLDPPGSRGILTADRAELEDQIRRAEEGGLQVAVHAQGDRAIRLVIEAFEAASAEPGALRHRIEHGGAFHPSLQGRAAGAGLSVVSQPGFLSQLGDGFLAAFGPERAAYLYPFRALRAAGVPVAGSSDTPVIPASPFMAMRDAILRRTKRGATVAPDEAVDAGAALDMYTRSAAHVSWWEDRLGSIATAKSADFVIIDRNPVDSDPESIAETRVLATFVDGVAVAGHAPEQFEPVPA